MQLNPYLNFGGNCEEAMNFYKSCLGGQFESINRFSEAPDDGGGMKIPADFKNKVMHMTWRFDDNVIMASDSPYPVTSGDNIVLCMNPGDRKKTKTAFEKLSAGGKVTMPLADTFWGAYFGMFTDKYGISWMLNCES